MSQGWRRSVPSWRNHDARSSVRPDWLLAAVGLMAMLLIEVWQCSTVASLSVQLGKAGVTLRQANAELGWQRSTLERASSRAQLGPLAAAIGLKPVDPAHIVSLPEDYLEGADPRPEAVGSPSLLALAGRAMQSLVPDASARGRRVN